MSAHCIVCVLAIVEARRAERVPNHAATAPPTSKISPKTSAMIIASPLNVRPQGEGSERTGCARAADGIPPGMGNKDDAKDDAKRVRTHDLVNPPQSLPEGVEGDLDPETPEEASEDADKRASG
jgi:hypothetical protein